ncbi:MAG: HD domain-containing protein [Bacteroidota bacterium]
MTIKGSMTEIGTYDWAKSTDSSLTKSDKRAIQLMIIKSQLYQLKLFLSTYLLLNKKRLSKIDFNDIVVPDSLFAKHAEDYANAVYNPILLNHCYRTYYFGALIGQYLQLKVDSEHLYISSLLHDLGLTNQYKKESCSCCFAVVGARRAEQFTNEIGMEEEASKKIFNAISMHLNPDISEEQDNETKLLSYGATLDVIGNKRRCVPKNELKKVLDAYPRKGFKSEILETLKNIDHFKDSRADYLKEIGFEGLIHKNKLNQIQQ